MFGALDLAIPCCVDRYFKIPRVATPAWRQCALIRKILALCAGDLAPGLAPNSTDSGFHFRHYNGIPQEKNSIAPEAPDGSQMGTLVGSVHGAGTFCSDWRISDHCQISDLITATPLQTIIQCSLRNGRADLICLFKLAELQFKPVSLYPNSASKLHVHQL